MLTKGEHETIKYAIENYPGADQTRVELGIQVYRFIHKWNSQANVGGLYNPKFHAEQAWLLWCLSDADKAAIIWIMGTEN